MDLSRLQNAWPDLKVESGVPATMRDGVVLRADIYRPSGEGPWPVLLMRQPYGRDIASTVVYAPPAWFARQGFLVVIQDVRGRGDSEGEFYPFRDERTDGYDTVEWAARLPGANGCVGMYGFSYQGYTQLAAAAAHPPSLKAIAPHMTAMNLYDGWFYRSGLLQLNSTLGWGNQMLRENARRAEVKEISEQLEAAWRNPSALCRELPVREVSPLTSPEAAPFVADWLTHDTDDSYWAALDVTAAVVDSGVPMFHLGGWYDYFLRGTALGYAAAKQSGAEQLLYYGPWKHIPWNDALAGWSFGPEAQPSIDAVLVRWFHHWLRPEAQGASEALPKELTGVRYFSLGEMRWREAMTWPPPEMLPRRWYLASKGRANSRFGDGTLVEELADSPCDTFNYDPEVPVLAPGGGFDGSLGWGPYDLSANEESNAVLVYTTAPATAAFRFAGAPCWVGEVRSSAEDTAFVARLSLVTRNGAARFLSLGATTLARGTRLENGRVRVRIVLDEIASSVAVGESLRLDLCSSAFPLLVRHPNSTTLPNAVSSPAEFRRAQQVVYHDRAAPSWLELPVTDDV